MLLPTARQDKLVRATDLDALSCKVCASTKGYFGEKDRFLAPLVASYNSNLQFCDGYTALSAERTLRAAFSTAKFPLINRGTFLRTRALDMVVDRFVLEQKKCQVLALGGGSDTRAFRVLEKYSQVKYMEVDFPELVKIKKMAILKLEILQAAVGANEGIDLIEVTSKEELRDMYSDFVTERYALVGFDLRLCSKGDKAQAAAAFLFLDSSLPTLIISECVLCYLSPGDFVGVLHFFGDFLEHPSLILFDPMSLEDGFGHSMVSNLSNRGIDLQTFQTFPTLESRQALLEEQLGFSAYLTDMAAVGGFSVPELNWLSQEEVQRISGLEMMDEVEEITLMLRHYSLIYGEKNQRAHFPEELQWKLQPKNK